MTEPIRAMLSPLMGYRRPSQPTADRPSLNIKSSVVLVVDDAPADLLPGIVELAEGAKRPGAVRVSMGETRVGVQEISESEVPWYIKFEPVPDFVTGRLEIVPSHEDFAAAELDSGPLGGFRVVVRYGRRCEAFRGLGHILAITRAVFTPVGTSTSARASQAQDKEPPSSSAMTSEPASSSSSAAISITSASSNQSTSARAAKALENDASNPVPAVAFGSPILKDATDLAPVAEEAINLDEDIEEVETVNGTQAGDDDMQVEIERSSKMGRKSRGAETEMNSVVGELLRRDETCLFETLGLMIDCSRNGVLKPESVKDMLRSLSLMGCNMCQLYTEDTYQLAGESFFGYFRGPYTQAELKDIDDYADALGIEMIPCIQTLGHLGQMLQWPRYAQMRDTHEVLLAGSSEVYAFIEKMISTVTAPFRSKRIHIGMDEAHGVSEGRYRQIYGYKESTQVFVDHLRRVNEICKRLGVEPMIWSDMLFCLHAKNNSLQGYYDSATPELVSGAIPPEIDLILWDYYHTRPEPYANKIAQHWQLAQKPPWMASGVWTWNRFWTALPFTFETVRAYMQASKANGSGVRHAMTTIWGDEGNECDIFSGLPGIHYFAEHAYTRSDEVDVLLLKRKFDGINAASFDDFVFASKLDDTQPESQPVDHRAHFPPNMSKWLMWEDPFYSFMAPQYNGYDLETHFGRIAFYLDLAMIPTHASHPEVTNLLADNPFAYLTPRTLAEYPGNARLRMPLLIAEALSLKCHLRERLVYAYKAGDKDELRRLGGPGADSRMAKLREIVNKLWRYHRNLWMSINKPFGWDVLDLRYGGLSARLNTMHERITAYLDDADGTVIKLEELEVQTEVVYPGNGPNLMLDYHRVSRPQYC